MSCISNIQSFCKSLYVWYFSTLNVPYRRLKTILMYCSMMYPVSEENCSKRRTRRRRIHFTHWYEAEDKVYLYAIFLLTLSPLISSLSRCGSRNFKRGCRVKGVDVEMNNLHIHVYKKIKHRLYSCFSPIFSFLNFYLCLVSLIL